MANKLFGKMFPLSNFNAKLPELLLFSVKLHKKLLALIDLSLHLTIL
jgi:hypothetical protein